MKVENIECVAVSKDGRFIAAGSGRGDVLVWGGTTYEQVFAGKITGGTTIYDVDFSTDSTRLVSADYQSCTAIIWDIATRKKVQTLQGHVDRVEAAKYSPQGDRIATATKGSIRVWDSNDGQLLVDVKLKLKPLHGLLWFNNHLFVKTKDKKIRQIEASTGSTVSKWIVPDASSYIALPQYGKFIAYSTRNSITFWDTSTHIQLNLIPRVTKSLSITFSRDDHLAIVTVKGRIIIEAPSLISVCLRMTKFSFLTCTSYTRSWTFALKTLCSMHGDTDNSQMQKRY